MLAAAVCQGGEDIESVFQAGMDALRVENNVAAIKAFTRAADIAEAAHDDAKAVEINSMIYYCHKKFTLAQAEDLHKTDEKVAVKAEAVVAKKVEPSDADKWLDRAQKFVATHKDDPLRCAATMFEVADRFSETAAGRSAMKESLSWVAKVKAKATTTVITPKTDPKPVMQQAEIPGEYAATHSGWGGKFILNADGTFIAPRVIGPGKKSEGKWVFDGKTLTLNWYQWSAEKLTLGANGFENDDGFYIKRKK